MWLQLKLESSSSDLNILQIYFFLKTTILLPFFSFCFQLLSTSQLTQQIKQCLKGKVKSTAENKDQEQCLVYNRVEKEKIAKVATLVYKGFKLGMKQKKRGYLH